MSRDPGGGAMERESVRDGRILFVAANADSWGGSEELWAGAAVKLCGSGAEVTATRKDQLRGCVRHPKWAHLEERGVRLRNVQPLGWQNLAAHAAQFCLPWNRRIKRFASDWFFARNLRRLLSDSELVVISQGCMFDGIQEYDFPGDCRAAGKPYVLICQKSSDLYWPWDPSRQRVQAAFQHAERVYFVSHHNRLLTEEQLGMSLPQAEVVFNPFMVSAEAPLDWPASDGSPWRLACVARLYPSEKGQDLLLRVLSRPKWRARDLDVNFFGSGVYRKGLEEMARFLRLERVRFCGFATDIKQVWREHQGLVLPSRAEGLPLALVEAMMCGRFGIVGDAGGSGEVFTDDVTGFLSKAPTEDSLDDAMERAWMRRAEWKQIGLLASKAIRRSVPGDPCGEFAARLENVVAAQRARVHSGAGSLRPVSADPSQASS